MVAVYVRNTKTGRKFRVVSFDKEKSEVTLKGRYGTFVEKYDKARFERLGYELVKEEEEQQEVA